MKNTTPQAIFLMGPTASGKTDLAVALRNHYPVDLISVDSALIYRGMNIGTSKPNAETLARAPHRLIDIRDPAQAYSVGDFAGDARREMDDIMNRGRIPLLVGGTMLYFRALLEGLADLPPSDPAIRARLEAQAAKHGWPYLHAELQRLDPDSAARIHPNHSQRIQRALEVCLISGRPFSQFLRQQQRAGTGIAPVTCDYNVVQIAVAPRNRAVLHERIEQRFQGMLQQGLVDEVRALYQRGDLTPELPALRAVGYRQVWDYLDGAVSYDDTVARGIAATRQLAKRQLTWLRGWPDLQWLWTDNEEGKPLTSAEILTNCLKILRKTPIYNSHA